MKLRNSLQTKLMASFVLLVLVISGLNFFYTFGETKKALKEILRDELGAVASTVATQIDGDSLATLAIGAESTATFIRIRDQLLAIQHAHPDIRYVYTFARAASDPTKVQFFVDAEYGSTDSTADPASIGDVYDETTPPMLDALVAPAVETDFATDQWGTFLSGYAPIRNRAGAVVGAVGIDMLSTRVLEKQAFIGNTIYFVVAVAILLAGAIIGLFIRAEKALWESEERYRTLVESVVDGIVIHVGDRVAFANRAAAVMLGFAGPAALVGQPLESFVYPGDLVSARDRVRRVLAGEAVAYPVEVRYVKQDGTGLRVENTGSLVAYKGKPAILTVIRDITERKRAEEAHAEFEVRNRQLEKAESLSRMAGAIAHHFNSQLQAVLLNLELARGDLPEATDAARSVADATVAANGAAEISRLMLTYLGQAPGVRESLDLSDACSRWLSLLGPALPKHVVLKTDLASPGPTIRANADQIRQVLTHLVTNAWEVGGSGRAEIQVTVKAVTAAAVPLAHRVPPDWQPLDPAYACLEVVDHGCGVAEADIEKLFDPFFSSKFTGRGLGLSIVLGIVRAHGGVVTVESALGLGSTFRVYLPVSEGGVPVPS